MENKPPLPGFFFSTLRQIAVTSLYASGSLSMMVRNSLRSRLVDGRQLIHLGPQNILKRFLVLDATLSFIFARQRSSSPATSFSSALAASCR